MDELLQSALNKKQQLYLSNFLNQYGISGLEQALQFFIDMQQEYVCKTKISISKIKINDIYYLKIQKHNISIYTKHDEYYKYGTLNNELKQLSAYNFVKCNQSCLVSIGKIKTGVQHFLLPKNFLKPYFRLIILSNFPYFYVVCAVCI